MDCKITEHVKDKLDTYNSKSIFVAYSGGLDSTVLLHIISRIKENFKSIVALHVHHGLSPNADEWQKHCASFAKLLGIDFKQFEIQSKPKKGESTEAWARENRYTFFKTKLGPGDVLLTGHHQDDQAETLLLQLLRGAGPVGLSAMPEESTFAQGLLYRPLLSFTRKSLEAYAQANQLVWVEDESNLDPKYRRNYIRNTVLPEIKKIWPSATQTLSRSAAHCAEVVVLTESLARQDLLTSQSDDQLMVSSLLNLDNIRRKNLIRYWVQQQGFNLPNEKHLSEINKLLKSKQDACPKVSWQGADLRRYQGRLYIEQPLEKIDTNWVAKWDGQKPLVIPGQKEPLTIQVLIEMGVNVKFIDWSKVSVRFRQGHERARPRGRGHTKTLKKLLQEYKVPPWLRSRVPLVYEGKEIIAVTKYFISDI